MLLYRLFGKVVAALLSVPEVSDSIPGAFNLQKVSQTTRHSCNASSEFESVLSMLGMCYCRFANKY